VDVGFAYICLKISMSCGPKLLPGLSRPSGSKLLLGINKLLWAEIDVLCHGKIENFRGGITKIFEKIKEIMINLGFIRLILCLQIGTITACATIS